MLICLNDFCKSMKVMTHKTYGDLLMPLGVSSGPMKALGQTHPLQLLFNHAIIKMWLKIALKREVFF